MSLELTFTQPKLYTRSERCAATRWDPSTQVLLSCTSRSSIPQHKPVPSSPKRNGPERLCTCAS
jgi:hypothetical protein